MPKGYVVLARAAKVVLLVGNARAAQHTASVMLSFCIRHSTARPALMKREGSFVAVAGSRRREQPTEVVRATASLLSRFPSRYTWRKYLIVCRCRVLSWPYKILPICFPASFTALWIS